MSFAGSAGSAAVAEVVPDSGHYLDIRGVWTHPLCRGSCAAAGCWCLVVRPPGDGDFEDSGVPGGRAVAAFRGRGQAWVAAGQGAVRGSGGAGTGAAGARVGVSGTGGASGRRAARRRSGTTGAAGVPARRALAGAAGTGGARRRGAAAAARADAAARRRYERTRRRRRSVRRRGSRRERGRRRRRGRNADAGGRRVHAEHPPQRRHRQRPPDRGRAGDGSRRPRARGLDGRALDARVRVLVLHQRRRAPGAETSRSPTPPACSSAIRRWRSTAAARCTPSARNT